METDIPFKQCVSQDAIRDGSDNRHYSAHQMIVKQTGPVRGCEIMKLIATGDYFHLTVEDIFPHITEHFFFLSCKGLLFLRVSLYF